MQLIALQNHLLFAPGSNYQIFAFVAQLAFLANVLHGTNTFLEVVGRAHPGLLRSGFTGGQLLSGVFCGEKWSSRRVTCILKLAWIH